jgi:hypothetical protein
MRKRKREKKFFGCFLMLPLPSTCSPLLGYQSFPSSGYPPMRPSKIRPRVPLPSPSKTKERLMGELQTGMRKNEKNKKKNKVK